MNDKTPLKGKPVFNLLTLVFGIVSLIAITKAVRYETQIKKIRRCTRAFFDDLESGRNVTKAVDNFRSEIQRIIHD